MIDRRPSAQAATGVGVAVPTVQIAGNPFRIHINVHDIANVEIVGIAATQYVVQIVG